MGYRLLADTVLVVHFLFIAFVVGGGFLAIRWRRVTWLHLPAAVWGAAIEFFGWVCPLTPLENHLRRLGGQAGYTDGFIEHYLMPLVYPPGLTRGTQLVLAGVVVVLNVAAYALVVRRWRAGRPRHQC
ncbi:MAG: DUF2784 domain-containing protein [Gemmatimonadota bacterium]|nr:DUF2784 domain-containing protein [Gemmatimonadota bacterium]